MKYKTLSFRLPPILAVIVTLLVATLFPSIARAQTTSGTLCIKANIEWIDNFGTSSENPDEDTETLKARGVYITNLKKGSTYATLNGSGNGPAWANQNGCVDWTVPTTAGLTGWTLNLRTKGILKDDVELYVFETTTASGSTQQVAAPGVNLSVGNVEIPLDDHLSTYATLAYVINEAFRGSIDGERIDVGVGNFPSAWSDANGFTGGGQALMVGGVGKLMLARYLVEGANQVNVHKQRYVIAHEYGHINLGLSAVWGVDDCGYGPGSHDPISLEWNSCAAMEGWADFVSVDSWNGPCQNHVGDRPGWLKYYGGFGNIDVEDGSGNCSTGYPLKYGDVCRCGGSSCDQMGTELDYVRALWDYHTDGEYLSHAELQEDMGRAAAGGPWSYNNFWDNWYARMIADYLYNPYQDHDRWYRFADATYNNGITEPP
jgi:hypothetical protein